MAVNDPCPTTPDAPTELEEHLARFAEDLTEALARDNQLDGFAGRCDALLALITEAQAFVAAAAAEENANG